MFALVGAVVLAFSDTPELRVCRIVVFLRLANTID